MNPRDFLISLGLIIAAIIIMLWWDKWFRNGKKEVDE